jgi:glycosyltransferase involved in cell wall biosynthesis
VEVVVVVDHNESLLQRARRELSDVTVLRNRFPRGVSGNRNTGALHAITPVVAFLDDDVVARPGWLAGLVAPLADPSVVGTGGAIQPIWHHRPAWVPEEFLWAYGGSSAGMPTATSTVRNVWSASMAVRRERFADVGGFRTDFGKIGDRSRPEDTELCLRLAHATGGRWVYVPQSLIGHPVDAAHTTLGYYLTRCYNEGRGKIAMARLRPGGAALDSERAYLRRTVPRALGRGLALAATGRDAAGAGRAGAIAAGVAAAAVGAAVELLHTPVRSTGPPETADSR